MRTDHDPAAPEGYGTVTPWIIVRGVPAFLDFLADAFGAVELERMTDDEGLVVHAEARIGDSVVMMFDVRAGWPDTPAFLRLYVPDVDATVARAIAAGAALVTEPTEVFWGERIGRVRDPWGNLWWVHQRVAELPEEEMWRRSAEPEHERRMQYVADSLDVEMRARGGRPGRTEGPVATG